MKYKLITALGMGLIATSTGIYAADDTANAESQSTNSKAVSSSTVLKSENDKLSYTIGADIGENLKAQNLNVDSNLVARGITDALSGSNMLMTKDEMKETITALQKKLIDEQKVKFEKVSEENAKKGEDFLAKNKDEKGVVTLPSGLQYKIVKSGKGKSPTENDMVTVDYEGKLVDGEVFDSSYQRGKPVQFKVSQVISGWQEALQKMQPGATWELFIPPQLAYGERGLGGPIGPNETLVFKVNLISVDKDADNGSKKNEN